MGINQAINTLLFMFYSVIGVGMFGIYLMTSVGYFNGMASIFIATLSSGIYVFKLTLSSIHRRDMKSSNFSHVGINKNNCNGYDITVRAFTNDPNKFTKSVPNPKKEQSIHEVLKCVRY